MAYTEEDYKKAISFALNHPPEIRAYHYNMHKDLYTIDLLETDNIVYTVTLQGWFIRKCLKWSGKKQWAAETRTKFKKD